MQIRSFQQLLMDKIDRKYLKKFKLLSNIEENVKSKMFHHCRINLVFDCAFSNMFNFTMEFLEIYLIPAQILLLLSLNWNKGEHA